MDVGSEPSSSTPFLSFSTLFPHAATSLQKKLSSLYLPTLSLYYPRPSATSLDPQIPVAPSHSSSVDHRSLPPSFPPPFLLTSIGLKLNPLHTSTQEPVETSSRC